eukprot:gene33734-43596_t
MKIFLGPTMATRRPTAIHLLSSDIGSLGGSPSLIRLDLENTSAHYSSSSSEEEKAKFDTLINKISAEKSTDANSRVYSEPVILRIYAANLPNIFFTDLPGIRTNDVMQSDDGSSSSSGGGVSIREMVCEQMKHPDTIIFALEAASCEDFATSHIAPLIKSMEAFRPNIFEHTVLVLSKCDKINPEGTDGDRLVKLVNGVNKPCPDYPFKHVVASINSIDRAAVTESDKGFAAFRTYFSDTHNYALTKFAKLKYHGKPLDPLTQCTTAAIFHRMEEISSLKLTASMQQGLAVLDSKINGVKMEILEKLAPPLSFYEDNSIFFTELINNVEYIAYSDIKKKFESKLYYSSKSASGDGRSCSVLQSIVLPEFKLGDFHIHEQRMKILDRLKDHVIEHLEGTILPVYEQMFDLDQNNHLSGIDKCLSREVSPFHRVDRFENLRNYILDEMQRQLPNCIDRSIKELDKCVAQAKKDTTSHTIKSILDQWTHIAVMQFMRKVNQVVSSLLAGSGEEAMWQESEGFSMERERLERRYHSLQLQRERLHNCLLQTNSGTSTLRDAVNEVATSTLSDAALAAYFNNLWQMAAQQQWSYVDKKKRDAALEAEHLRKEENQRKSKRARSSIPPPDSGKAIDLISDDEFIVVVITVVRERTEANNRQEQM